jgi:hypothetical protein
MPVTGRRPAIASLACLLAAGCAAPSAAPVLPPGWTVLLNPRPLADAQGGGGGQGTIAYGGHVVPFRTGGLGVYGAQVALVAAIGRVQGLARLEDFAGRYRADGAAFDPRTDTNDLILRNQNWVRLHLRAIEPGTQMPRLGGDALDITLGSS